MNKESKETVTLGFIGLGHMGLPIATNLLKAGYQLRVYNRTEQKAGPVIAAGAKWVDSPSGVIEPGGIVFTMLADDAAVESIAVSNPDFLDRFSGGGVHISMSTIAPQTARNLAEQHAKKGVAYLAAPVIGRPNRKIASLQKRIVGTSRTSETITINQLPWLNRYRICVTESDFSKRTRNDIPCMILHRDRDRLKRHSLSAKKV